MLGYPNAVTQRSADELIAAARENFRPHMPGAEYVNEAKAIEADAERAIRGYARVFRTTPAVALLRIAAAMSGDSGRDLIEAVGAVLDISDHDDAAGALDDAHKALSAYAEKHFDID